MVGRAVLDMEDMEVVISWELRKRIIHIDRRVMMSLSYLIMTHYVFSCSVWFVLGGLGGYGGGAGAGYHLGAGQKAVKRGTKNHEIWKCNHTGQKDNFVFYKT